jgi:hypothetical protein
MEEKMSMVNASKSVLEASDLVGKLNLHPSTNQAILVILKNPRQKNLIVQGNITFK